MHLFAHLPEYQEPLPRHKQLTKAFPLNLLLEPIFSSDQTPANKARFTGKPLHNNVTIRIVHLSAFRKKFFIE
jgi:hypothetical protein